MKQFLKDGLSALAIHWGTSCICLLFCFGIGALMQGWQIIFAILILTVVYGVPVLRKTGVLAQRDKKEAKLKQKSYKLWYGFAVGFFACSVNFILGLGLYLGKAAIIVNYLGLFKVLNPTISPYLILINTSVYFQDFSMLQVTGYVLCTLIPMLFWGVLYIFGYKEMSIKEKIIYKNK